MIFSSIHTRSSITYPEAIETALKFLKSHDFTSMEPGRYEIQGDDIFANLMDAQTKPLEETKPEAHKEYIDVQFVVSGTEKLGFAPDTGSCPPCDHPEGEDIWFYEGLENESFVISTPGCFSIFFPEDIHRPCVCQTKPEAIRKVVVKVRVSAL
ncbi:MAG: YhcH/YjgK/YiaL family protein [Eubacteriales bacterium]|nr:YhcH/YjgK/YiaL family protein [Eubacteriales bacterium]